MDVSLHGVDLVALRHRLEHGWNPEIVDMFWGQTLNVDALVAAASIATDGDAEDIAVVIGQFAETYCGYARTQTLAVADAITNHIARD